MSRASRRIGASLACLALGASLSSGCVTTWRPVSPEKAGIRETLAPNDEVRIVTRDGRRLDLYATDATEEALVGVTVRERAPVTVAFSEIARIERREGSRGAAVALVVLYVALMVASIVLLGSIAAGIGESNVTVPGHGGPEPPGP